MRVEACTPGRGPRIMFSALDANAAKDIEPAFARAGHIVISNARSYRMDPSVPLLIPEINPDHLNLLTRQRKEHAWAGAIVTNPNCSTVVLAMVHVPSHARHRHSVFTEMTLASVSTILLRQNGQQTGRVTTAGDCDSDILGLSFKPNTARQRPSCLSRGGNAVHYCT